MFQNIISLCVKLFIHFLDTSESSPSLLVSLQLWSSLRASGHHRASVGQVSVCKWECGDEGEAGGRVSTNVMKRDLDLSVSVDDTDATHSGRLWCSCCTRRNSRLYINTRGWCRSRVDQNRGKSTRIEHWSRELEVFDDGLRMLGVSSSIELTRTLNGHRRLSTPRCRLTHPYLWLGNCSIGFT